MQLIKKQARNVARYFRNIWSALRGRTGFRLWNAQPETWYHIKGSQNENYGWIKTNKHGHFVPFIQSGDEFKFEKPHRIIENQLKSRPEQFMTKLADLIETYNASLKYTTDDDGIHISVDGVVIFADFLSNDNGQKNANTLRYENGEMMNLARPRQYLHFLHNRLPLELRKLAQDDWYFKKLIDSAEGQNMTYTKFLETSVNAFINLKNDLHQQTLEWIKRSPRNTCHPSPAIHYYEKGVCVYCNKPEPEIAP